MAEALSSNRSRDVWSEVKQMKGRSRKSAFTIDGVIGQKDIADLFYDKIIHCIILSHLIMMICFVLDILFTIDCNKLGVQVM